MQSFMSVAHHTLRVALCVNPRKPGLEPHPETESRFVDLIGVAGVEH